MVHAPFPTQEHQEQSQEQALVWRPIETAPKDGTPVWAFLCETGIRLVRWMSPAECAEYEGDTEVDEYDGCWVEVAHESEDWSPEWWAPLDAIPVPVNADRMRAAIAKALGQ